MPLDPSNFTLNKAWSVLKEARKNRNGLSAAIYNKFAHANAMPVLDSSECAAISNYREFVKVHNKIWLMQD